MEQQVTQPARRPLPTFVHPRIFRIGEDRRDADPVRPSGFAELDRELPGGGWPHAGLIEIGCDQSGVGELSLLLQGPQHTLPGPLLWVLPDNLPWVPYAPGLIALGVELSQLAIARTRDNKDALWAAEQALRSGACRSVVLWLAGSHCSPLSLRRLQQAAMMGSAAVFAIRPLAALAAPSPAMLRIGLHAEVGGALRLELVKRRGLPAGKSLTLVPRKLPCLDRAGVVPTPPDRWLQRILSGATQRKRAALPQG